MEVWALVISIISVLIAGVALWQSKKTNDLANTTFEREKEKERPILFNVHVDRGDRFVFIIEDYSANKNLRIDKIEFIRPEDEIYREIKFEVNRNDGINPPQMTVNTQDSFNILDAVWFKIYTSSGHVLEHREGSLFSAEKPDA